MFIITGNHDTYYKNSLKPSSLQIFENSPKIRIIDEPFEWNNILMVPWAQDVPDTNCEYCFGHFDINGSKMNNKKVCDNGKYTSEMFKRFKQVYSGHFHTPSTNGNVTYLGSPFQQTFHDTGNTLGYYIFENEYMEFKEFNQYPKFTIIKANDIIEESMVKGNIVKIVFNENISTNENEKLMEKISSFSPLRLSVDFSSIPTDNMEPSQNFNIESHEEILEEWIDNDKNIGKSIDKNKVKKLLTEMMEKL
jgi:hypothetical protein